MNRLLLGLVLALFSANASAYTISELRAYCSSSDDVKTLVCVTYIAGVAHAMHGQVYDSRAGGMRFYVYFPADWTAGRGRSDFLDVVDGLAPRMDDRPAAFALQTMWAQRYGTLILR